MSRPRLLVTAVVFALLAAACGGGGGGAATATTSAGSDATTTIGGEDRLAGVDPCDLLTQGDAADLAGADVTPTTGGSFGRAIGCSYQSADDTGSDAGAALASLTLEEDDQATADSVKALLTDQAGSDATVETVDIGDGGASATTDSSVQVVYIVEHVVVTIVVNPPDGVDDDVVSRVVEFGTRIVDPIKEAVGLDAGSGSSGRTTTTEAAGETTTTFEVDTTASIDDLSGRWQSTYGYASFFADGQRLIGVYETDHGTITIRPTDEPGVFAGWWTEEPTRQPDNDAGNLVLRAFRDENGQLAFDGLWSYGDTEPTSEWLFTRTTDEPPPGLEDVFSDRSQFDDLFIDHP